MPITPTTSHMLDLLRGSLNQRIPDIPTLDTDEWGRLFVLGRKHGVVTMIYDAIEMLPADKQPIGDIALSWTLSADRTRYHYAHQKQVLEFIDQKAKAEGLPYVLLKGMSLSRYYPRPDSRPCGDIDICFPHNFERGNTLLGHPEANAVGKHAEMKIDGVTVENHRQLLDLNFDSQRQAEAYIWKALEQVPDDHLLPPTANMVYLLMHTVSHLTARFKLPLRNILDWGMFLRANHQTLNPDECHAVMKSIGMVDSFNILTLLAGDYIGTDLSMFVIGHVRPDDITRMNKLILTREYLASVPKDLPFLPRIVARMKRRRQRRWLYRYLPASRAERRQSILKSFYRKKH